MKHSIVMKLRDRDWEDFHKLLLNRWISDRDASRWLADRGYRISRSSVGRYRQLLDRSSLTTPAAPPIPFESSKLQNYVRRVCAALDGRELLAVAMFARFLGCGGARRRLARV